MMLPALALWLLQDLNSDFETHYTKVRESTARADFHPRLTPRYSKGDELSALAIEASQRLPWSGGSLSAAALFRDASDLPPPSSHSSELRLTLTQPLLRGFGPNTSYYDLTNSRRARQGQERAYELSRQRLAIQVASAFYQVVQQRQLLLVARQSLERSENLMRASDARLKVGLASKLDLFRAQLQASQARDAMIRAQASLGNALEYFRFLLALPPTDPVEPEAVGLPELPAEGPEPLEALVARALAQRLELHEARDQVDDTRRGTRLARQNLLPQLDLNLALVQTGFGPSFGSAFPGPDRRIGFFLTTSFPLERTADRANRAIAELNEAASRRALRQRELEVEAEVRAALRELSRIRESVELQRAAVDVAEQQRRLADLRYERGLASNFDVVDAEASLVAARSALVGLLTSYQIARLELRRVTGGFDPAREFRP